MRHIRSDGPTFVKKCVNSALRYAKSSGQLGRNFIPHFTGGVQCFLNDLTGKPTTDDEGFLDHAYLPSFMHKRKRDYARSFGAQFNYQNRRAVGWARSLPDRSPNKSTFTATMRPRLFWRAL